METDEVDAAFQAAQQADQRVGVALVVIEPCEHRVFETHAALAAEVVLADERDDVPDVPGLLGRHQGEPFVGEGVVEADRQVAFLLVEEAL